MTQDLDHIPDTMLAWPLFVGRGLEILGRSGRQAGSWPAPAPDKNLVRSDAVGLCYSDVKVIRQGGSHHGSTVANLARRPVVGWGMRLGKTHSQWRWARRGTIRFRPGQRFAIQADFYYRGRNLAYGYVFTGGLAQSRLLGAARWTAMGSCVAGFPVPEGLGYAEVALSPKPWRCVEAAYVPRRRLHVKAEGSDVAGRAGPAEDAYRLGATSG